SYPIGEHVNVAVIDGHLAKKSYVILGKLGCGYLREVLDVELVESFVAEDLGVIVGKAICGAGDEKDRSAGPVCWRRGRKQASREVPNLVLRQRAIVPVKDALPTCFQHDFVGGTLIQRGLRLQNRYARGVVVGDGGGDCRSVSIAQEEGRGENRFRRH